MKGIRKIHKLTHVGHGGQATMVDVGEKLSTKRIAKAQGKVIVGSTAFDLVKQNLIKKGDVLGVARIAGIQGAKKTSDLIPLCHPLLLSDIKLDFELLQEDASILVKSQVTTVGQTGVEMEAITAVMVACCNIYDMCKAVNKGIVITNVELVSKTGGKSGDYHN